MKLCHVALVKFLNFIVVWEGALPHKCQISRGGQQIKTKKRAIKVWQSFILVHLHYLIYDANGQIVTWGNLELVMFDHGTSESLFKTIIKPCRHYTPLTSSTKNAFLTFNLYVSPSTTFTAILLFQFLLHGFQNLLIVVWFRTVKWKETLFSENMSNKLEWD